MGSFVYSGEMHNRKLGGFKSSLVYIAFHSFMTNLHET